MVSSGTPIRKEKKPETVVIKQKPIEIFQTREIRLNPFTFALLSIFISWPLIYILFFVTQPQWALSNESYMLNFAGGSGVANTNSTSGLSNTILTEEGRSRILWISFLFSLIVFIFVYFLFYLI